MIFIITQVRMAVVLLMPSSALSSLLVLKPCTRIFSRCRWMPPGRLPRTRILRRRCALNRLPSCRGAAPVQLVSRAEIIVAHFKQGVQFDQGLFRSIAADDRYAGAGQVYRRQLVGASATQTQADSTW